MIAERVEAVVVHLKWPLSRSGSGGDGFVRSSEHAIRLADGEEMLEVSSLALGC